MTPSDKQCAHAILDLVTGFDGDNVGTRTAFSATVQRVQEADGIVASTDESGDLSIDMGTLLTGAGVATWYLVDSLARALGTTREEVLFDARAFVDSLED